MAVQRNSDEHWRAVRQSAPNGVARGGQAGGSSRIATALAGELRDLREWLLDVGADRLARQDVEPLLRHVEAFGFHLATVDVRQNSAFP